MDSIKDQYDYILLDSPPTLGVLVNNIIYASDFIIIPCEISIYSLEGMGDLIASIRKIKRDDNFNRFKVLLTKFDSRTTTSNAHVLEQIKAMQLETFSTYILRNEALNQASMAGKTIFDFDSSSKGAECYKNLIREIVEL